MINSSSRGWTMRSMTGVVGRSAHSEWVVYQAVRLRETVEQVALGDRLVAYILSVEFPGEPQPTQDQIENYARRAADWVLLGRCAKFY